MDASGCNRLLSRRFSSAVQAWRLKPGTRCPPSPYHVARYVCTPNSGSLCCFVTSWLVVIRTIVPACTPIVKHCNFLQIEAVGHNYLGTFFASADALLAPGGVMVMQAITTPENRYEEYIRSTDFINTIIFPGNLTWCFVCYPWVVHPCFLFLFWCVALVG